MTKLNSIFALVTFFAAMTLSSCGGDDNSKTNFIGGEVPFNSNSEREHLETTANTFIGYFNASDQKGAIEAMNEFVELCSTYTLPDNYVDDRYFDLHNSAAAYAKAAAANDYLAMSRATTELVYNLARFQGLYQANAATQTWDKIENRDHINFRFWLGSREINLTLQGDGGSWSNSYTNADHTFNVEMPRNLTLNMNSGSIAPYTNLMNATVTSDIKNNEYANIKVFNKFGNVVVDTNIKGKSASITEETTLYIDNVSSLVRSTLASSSSTILGHDLCSAALWDKIIQDDNDAHKSALIGDLVSSFSNTLMVLQSVQLKSSANDITALIDYTDGYWDKSNSPNPEQSAKDAAAYLSRTFTSQMYFADGTKNPPSRGTIAWEAYQSYEDPTYVEWAIRPTITLVSDGSITDFQSFFGNGRFFSVERNFQSLMNGYKSYWK